MSKSKKNENNDLYIQKEEDSSSGHLYYSGICYGSSAFGRCSCITKSRYRV